MQFVYYLLFALGIAAADQVTKFLTVTRIPLYDRVEVLPGFLGLTYVRNTGAAFSMLEGLRWVFVVLFLVLTGLILLEYFKKPQPFSKFDRWCIAAIYGGGLGNMIDRLRLGYVVDMIETRFMTFPVFNLADCFVTCGCIALGVSLVFFNRKFWKEEKK